jgi:RNA polymerase sigma-70 factor (ECF subfamily)
VYRTTGNPSDADDIVQEAFFRVLRANPNVEGDDLRPYIFRVASNLMVDRWRKVRRERGAAVAEESSGRVEHESGGVITTFAALTPRERSLLWLAYVEEHDHRAIAKALGIARGSVKVLLSRARQRLRGLITDGRKR